MISFKESLEIKKTETIAYKCFYEMALKGINPESFVDWLDKHSETNNLILKCEEWVNTELKINEQGFFQKVGNWMQNLTGKGSQNQDPLATASNQAVAKISDLIKKSNRQGSRLAQKEIQDSLYNVLQTLKNTTVQSPVVPSAPKETPPVPKPITPMPGSPQTIDQAQKQMAQQAKDLRASSGEEYFGDNTINPLDKKLMEIRIRNLCTVISDSGYNPKSFAEWLTSEFILDESSWLGGALAGIKGGIKGGWERLMGGGEGGIWDAFRKGYRGGRDDKYDQYDLQSIEDAVKHLNDFSAKLGSIDAYKQLSQQLGDLASKLKNAAIAKPPEPAVEAPKPKTDDTAVDPMAAAMGSASAKPVDPMAAAMGSSTNVDTPTGDSADLIKKAEDFIVSKKGNIMKQIQQKWKTLSPEAKKEIANSQQFKAVQANSIPFTHGELLKLVNSKLKAVSSAAAK